MWPPGRGQFWPQGHNLNNFGRGPLDDAIYQIWKLIVSDKKIFENCILKTYFLTPWPTYATNQNHLNNFGRGLPRDHFCEVWSKSNEWCQRMDDDGRRTKAGHNSSPEHFVLRWAKKNDINFIWVNRWWSLKYNICLIIIMFMMGPRVEIHNYNNTQDIMLG